MLCQKTDKCNTRKKFIVMLQPAWVTSSNLYKILDWSFKFPFVMRRAPLKVTSLQRIMVDPTSQCNSRNRYKEIEFCSNNQETQIWPERLPLKYHTFCLHIHRNLSMSIVWPGLYFFGESLSESEEKYG